METLIIIAVGFYFVWAQQNALKLEMQRQMFEKATTGRITPPSLKQALAKRRIIRILWITWFILIGVSVAGISALVKLNMIH